MSENITPEQLVRFLAVKGMGYEKHPEFEKSVYTWFDPKSGKTMRFDPVNSPADRDMLVERMREKGIVIKMQWNLCGDVSIGICNTKARGPETWNHLSADTPGDAVCLAAAKALMAMKETPHE